MHKPTLNESQDQQGSVTIITTPYVMYETVHTVKEIHIYISSEVGDPTNYIDLIHTINTASQNDVIYIHLNTPGGDANTGVQILNAIKHTPAHVVTVLDGVVQSLGTLIFLAGDEMIVNDNCMMMFHNFSVGIAGKGNELSAQLDATIKWFMHIGKQLYVPFMSDAEFNRIMKGEDMWLQSADVRKRLNAMSKVRSSPKAPKPAAEPPST